MCKFKKVLQGKELYLDIPHQLISEDIRTLLELEVEEFSTVFGCEVYFQKPPAYAPRWIFRPRHQGMDAAELEWSPGTKALISYADNEDEALQTFSLLHTLARTDKNSVEYSPPCTTQEAAYLIRDEVLNTFPSFELRKINPVQWAKQFDEPAPKDWNEFKYWAQKLIAQLQDAHTSIIENRFSGFVPPYRVRLYETGIILDRVPFNSDADQAGVAPGWMVRVEDSLRWLTTTGATPQQYRQIAARKALTANHDYQQFTAFSPDGSQQISWDENPQQLILRDIVDVNQMDDCITYIGLRSFSPVPGLLSLFKDVCASSSEYSHMLLDLRGNVGGSIVLARELQPLFLREKTQIGSASFTDGCGHLGPVFARYACPSLNARWLGTLEILIDSMTYSAAEDFILGLKGLSHVSVRGERTGGGSGRPRSVPIGPDLSLRISTAITFEKGGSPVEHFGIEPDVAEPLS